MLSTVSCLVISHDQTDSVMLPATRNYSWDIREWLVMGMVFMSGIVYDDSFTRPSAQALAEASSGNVTSPSSPQQAVVLWSAAV